MPCNNEQVPCPSLILFIITCWGIFFSLSSYLTDTSRTTLYKKICAYTLNQSHSRTLKNLCCHHILSPQFSILHQLSAFRQRMCNEPYQKSRSCKTLLKTQMSKPDLFSPVPFLAYTTYQKRFQENSLQWPWTMLKLSKWNVTVIPDFFNLVLDHYF